MKKFALLIVPVLIFFAACSEVDSKYVEGDPFPKPPLYSSPDAVTAYLQEVSAAYPDITRLEIIGTSAGGMPIPALIITDNPGANEPGEPRIRLTGDIHGNEYISGEILLKLVKYLTENYNSAAPGDYVTRLVNSRYIAVIPMMNPDGVAAGERSNANGVDLNRNFEFAWTPSYDHGASPFSEPETRAVRDFSLGRVFHLSATYHSGAVVVNMPFDYARERDGTVPAEYDLVKYLALVYATSGTFLDNPDVMNYSYVHSGTVNGGDWYIVNGSMQDWSYMNAGCLDFTIEVALSSPQTEEGIDTVFLYNRESMLAYIDAAGSGVYGTITGPGGVPVKDAVISVTGGDLKTYSDADGYYFKVLKEGSYTVSVTASGYTGVSFPVTITSTDRTKNVDVLLVVKQGP